MYHLSADVFHSQFLQRHKVIQFAILISETTAQQQQLIIRAAVKWS